MAQSKLSTVEAEHHDEIILNWSIPNFKKLYDNAIKAIGVIIVEEKFTVGGKNWGFQLTHGKEDFVGIFLNFYGSDTASAEYTVYLKTSEGNFINTLDTGLKKYAPLMNGEGTAPGWGRQQWKSLSQLQNGGFLSDETLNLKFIVKVYTPKAQLKMNVSKDFRKGLDSSVGSDVTFLFVEEEGSQIVIGQIKAHKAILSLRSSVFATMFGSGMTEATTGEVKISDISPKAFRILLNFIYSGEVDAEWGSVAEELIYGADKYELGELQKYLSENVDPVLTVKNVMKIRNLATLYNLPKVLESTLKFIKENAKEFFEKHDVIFKDEA